MNNDQGGGEMPTTQHRKFWTRSEVEAALRAFHQEHGRPPQSNDYRAQVGA